MPIGVIRMNRILACVLSFACVLALAGCSSLWPQPDRGALLEPDRQIESVSGQILAPAAAGTLMAGAGAPGSGTRRPAVENIGQGEPSFSLHRSGGSRRTLPTATGNRQVSLNYTDQPVNRVVREVVGDVLGQIVMVDPSVVGRMTLVTTQAVPITEVPERLDQALQALGYGLSLSGGRVRVGRLADLEGGVAGGDEIRLIPLRSVAAADVLGAVQSSLPEGVRLQADPGGRGLTAIGPASALRQVEDLVALFDVDALRGRSFGLYPLSQSIAAAVARELELVFSGVRGLRISPVGRSNAVLVVADRPEILRRVRQALVQLDTPPQAQASLQVVPVLQRRAQDLAEILGRAFGTIPHGPGTRTSPAGAFGGLSLGGHGGSGALDVRVPGIVPGAGGSVSLPPSRGSDGGLGAGASPLNATPGPLAGQGPGGGPVWAELGLSGPVRIQADTGRNALLVLAAPADVAIITAAIRQLDQRQRQVYIEAVIAEVTLTDSLRFGIDFALRTGAGSVLSQLSPLVNPVAGGFSYVLARSNIDLTIQALSGLTDVRVVSAPRLLVLDNETATLQIGDQVPILTQTSQSTTTPGAPIVSSVELRDTGVILAVRPRIGAGSTVALDLFQEVSDAVRTTVSTINSPTIQQRRLQSTINARSGETVALGGLMRDRVQRSRNGIPFLVDLPLVGPLFGNRMQENVRTELLVLLSPRVVDEGADTATLVDELRARLGSLAPDLAASLEPTIRRPPASVPGPRLPSDRERGFSQPPFRR